MSELFRLLVEKNKRSTSVVGMTKNVGKTVTFNYLAKHFSDSSTVIGLLSSGYDGERFDRLTLKEKPKIFVPVGSYLATAKACFEAADARLKLIEELSISTPLGPICIGYATESGYVELAGAASISELKTIIHKMFILGAEHILVDGAINRLASASPQVTESTILASGASLGPTMDDVIKKTAYRCTILNTPALENDDLSNAVFYGLEKGRAAFIYKEGDSYRAEPVRGSIPLLAGLPFTDKAHGGSIAVALCGAVVDAIIAGLMDTFEDLPLVVARDATRIFVTPGVYSSFVKNGGRLAVLNRLNLTAVTVNPTDPSGRDYDPKMFLKMMAEALSPCPVFDLVLEA